MLAPYFPYFIYLMRIVILNNYGDVVKKIKIMHNIFCLHKRLIISPNAPENGCDEARHFHLLRTTAPASLARPKAKQPGDQI